MKPIDIVDAVLLSTGLVISVQDIQAILSIVIIIIDILWILFRIVFKVINALKDGKVTDEELKDIEDEINKLHDKKEDD